MDVTSLSYWLVDKIPYELFLMDAEGNLVFANQVFFDKMGYGRNDIKKLSIFDINITSSPESWKEHLKLVKKKGVFAFKEVHKDKFGNFHEVAVDAIHIGSNGSDYICALTHDISDSSFSTFVLNATEELANVGGWKLNLNEGSIIVSRQCFKIFDLDDKLQFLPGQIINQFKEPEKLKALLSGVLKNGLEYDNILESRHQRKKFIRCIAKPIYKGKRIIKITGSYQDVTEQVERESSLQLFKEIIDNAEDLVYVYDKKGKLLHYSNSVVEELGFQKSELDNFSIYDLDPKITKEWWGEHFEDIIKSGAVHLDWKVSRKDGSVFPVDITANHLRFNGQDLNCAIVRDVTERNIKDEKLKEAFDEISSLKERLEEENVYLREEINLESDFEHIICVSERYAQILRQVEQVAPTDSTVLITGESGTGKELLARALHENSKRKDKPLIKINCATLPKELIESELFGHKKGAFTGAFENKIGKFTLADGGTLFLDEIGELPLELQPKLLRVLQDGEFDELGGTRTQKVNTRIIAATNRDLEKMVREGSFREDLYYRLNVFPIYNIPLREHKEDIGPLAEFFLEKYANKAGKHFSRLSKQTLERLMDYDFPGNIRELENLIERAVIIENGPVLGPGNWLPKSKGIKKPTSFVSFEQSQKDYIIQVLNYTNWRVSGPSGAAAILNMNDKTLFAKMKRLGIEKVISYKSD